MHAVIVSVVVKPEMRERFLAVIEDDATSSVRDEPGCLRFDVLQDLSNPNRYYFYEVYQDEAALEAHRRTPHLARWLKAAEECLAEPARRMLATTIFPRDYS